MKRVLTAVILIPIVVLALFRAPLWLFTVLVLGVALLAAREYFDIAEKTGFRPMRAIGYGFVVLMFACEWLAAVMPGLGIDIHVWSGVPPLFAITSSILLLFGLLPALLFLASGLHREPLSRALADAAVSYIMLPYVGFTLIAIPLLRAPDLGALYLLYLMLLVWCGDIAAYYVGRAIGKHKLAPRISPGKTWEGAIASVVAAVIVGLLLFHYINPIADACRGVHLLVDSASISSRASGESFAFSIAPTWFVVGLAVCVNVAAQVGDLVESALKRGAGMKDSGTLLPGHGGVLDRIDALLFALPVGLLFYAFGMSRYFEPLGSR